ncbi:MAG: hypothetical protein V1880_04520 [Patescibacteria group bacterium]
MSIDRDPSTIKSCFEGLFISIQTYRNFDAIPGLFWRAVQGAIVSEKIDVSGACGKIAYLFGVSTDEVQMKLAKWPSVPREIPKGRETQVRQAQWTRKGLKTKVFPLKGD